MDFIPLPARCSRIMRSSVATVVALVAILAAVAWRGAPRRSTPSGPSPRSPTQTPSTRASAPAPRLPGRGGALAPSLARLVPGDPGNGTRLTQVEECAECHPDVASQWRASAHARASFDNPYYRSVIDRFRKARGKRASRFCAGCHEPALLVSGAIDRPIRADDPRAHVGVGCMVCHGIRDVRPDGNASYTLTTAPAPPPDPADAKEVARHRARMAPPTLRTSALCGSCHRSFLGPGMGNPHHLPGIDDLGAWRRSPYSGNDATRIDRPIAAQQCRGCHMPDRRSQNGDMAADAHGRVASHRIAGGHRTLAALGAGDEQARIVRDRLQSAATIDVAAAKTEGKWTRPADGAPVEPGTTLQLDVVIRNIGAGHRFPGGTRDIQDTWVEVVLIDAHGDELAAAGTKHAHDDGTSPSTFRLRATALDSRGRIEEAHRVHRFRAIAFDHTIPARDAKLVRYEWRVPDALARSRFPLQVRARLLHRRHGPTMHRLACQATQSTRGRAFAAASKARGRKPIDGCSPQPITEIARRTVWIGRGARAREGEPADDPWRRLYDHALALTHARQEHLGQARGSIEHALDALRGDGATVARRRAMTMAVAAQIATGQGRRDDALRWLARAEDEVGTHPAITRLRGQAHASVWDWPRAAGALGEAARRVPRDPAGWRLAARAYGSARRDRPALEAARQGLRFSPRDPDLLRSQALALEALNAPAAPRAHRAFLRHRRPDRASALRARCGRQSATCQRDRQPIPTITLRRP